MAHICQSRPDYGLGFPVTVRETFQVVPFLLGSGSEGVSWTRSYSQSHPPSNVDVFVPYTQHVNLGIVCQAEGGGEDS